MQRILQQVVSRTAGRTSGSAESQAAVPRTQNSVQRDRKEVQAEKPHLPGTQDEKIQSQAVVAEINVQVAGRQVRGGR